jgi:HAE1 family hydrophobic/amphiphilic exporter-1
MRIWLDPERAASFDLTPGEVVEALKQNNVQVASGTLNLLPVPSPGAFEINIETQGRLQLPEQFEKIVVKRLEGGRTVRIGDIARVELGAQDYSTVGYLDKTTALPIIIFQRPGSNALETSENLIDAMNGMAADFPVGVGYEIVYNPTEFIEESVDAVYTTILEAVALVVLVIVIFLQSIRASIIPIIAIPVSLIGTFGVMAAFGLSLNNLSLFGLVLAIGIVVDDAIVVVENVERYLREGLSPREAAHKTMDEVGGALIAIALVLTAVFIPTAFIEGISGQFYRQFALTIATATIISMIVSLTLSPALAALLLKAHDEGQRQTGVMAILNWPFRKFSDGFNWAFDRLAGGYAAATRRMARVAALMMIVYAGLVGLTVQQFQSTPTGFIPDQDQGYLIAILQLPPGSSLDRTNKVVQDASARLLEVDGVAHTVAFAGLDAATFTNAPNAGAIFLALDSFAARRETDLTAQQVLQSAQAALGGIQEAFAFIVAPPPVRGVGNAGGWKIYVQDRRNRGIGELEAATKSLMAAANQTEGLTRVFTLFNTGTPKIYADIDRVKAEMLGVPTDRILEALEVYLGSAYINDFNFLGRTFRVTAQADGIYRDEQRDVAALRTRSDSGEMVPIGSVATFRYITGPHRVPRYNLYPSAELQGSAAPGVSTGEAIKKLEAVAAEVLPEGFGFEWTELALQEKLSGDTSLFVFGLAVVFVFLLLSALYESWLLPLAVVLIVPMCLLAAVVGVNIRGLENNILVQIGFVVLIGLSAKNAILIIEFARQAEAEGASRLDAAVQAARTRLRPILMTSFAFILGVVPLVIATGAGAEMRIALGTAVFSGMIGVTFFGLIFTPAFYVACRWIAGLRGGGTMKEQPVSSATGSE